jgi:hypothetical protein
VSTPLLRPDRPDVIDEVFESETVVVHLRTGAYFAFDESAGVLWRLLEPGRGLPELAALAAERHGLSEADVRAFVEQLRAAELVVAADAPLAAGELPEARPLGPPVVQVFTDMQDLLLLDPVHDLDLDGDGWPVAAADPPSS